ncbi:MAG: Hsp70 family protein [Planctomycetota bacterium]|nr:Hsp70 family protein [Planctomycetota bacterium]
MNEGTQGQDVIVGIDLGTTFSLVAICDERGPRCIPDDQGRALLPSVVRYESPEATGPLRTLVGWQARDESAEHPRTTISSVKRLMGRSLSDAAGDASVLSYEVVEGPGQTARVRLPTGGAGRLVSPQEVSAAVLAELRSRASAALGATVNKAVVTVPAYFDDAQRQATRDAGRLAGLDVVRIVNEPTAAALAYGIGLERSARRNAVPPEGVSVAVYDLGGGTFDVSILRVSPASEAGETSYYEVVSTAGDTRLGGDDFDHALARHVLDSTSGQRLDDLDAGDRRALVLACERAKRELSDRLVATVVANLPSGGVTRLDVTRETFESLIAADVERTFQACARAWNDAEAKLPPGGVESVVLVGGSSRIPLVRRRVAAFFGVEPYAALDPDQVVALGAAVQASILQHAGTGRVVTGGGVGRPLLLDVVPLSLGIETVGGAVAKLVMRNAAVPAVAREMFSTSVDGQTSIRLTVYQGEREMAEHCRKLGEFHVRGIPPMPAGIPQLEVTFLIDANGVLNVAAVERRSGVRAQLQVVPNHGLTREEINQIQLESIAHTKEDMTRHRVTDLIASTKLDLKWIGETLARWRSSLEPEYVRSLEAGLGQVGAMIDAASADWRSVDPDAMHKAKDALDRASMKLHETAIREALRTTGSPPPG